MGPGGVTLIRIVNSRFVVEKPSSHLKYYPKVISASTQTSYPFSVSAADVTVISNSGARTAGYVSPVSYGDIVRLQVSVKNHRDDATVWQDLFHGKIETPSCTFGTDNKLKLYCVGHEEEIRTDLIEETKSYTTATDAQTLLSYFSKYFNKLTYSASMADTGVSFPTYDTTKDQTYLADLIQDMEKNAGYDWAFKVVPTYDSSKNLSTIYVQWKAFSTTPVTSYRIIEGTQRLISADFEADGESVRTFQRIYGYTPEGSSQITGSAIDAALVALYGKRSEVNTYPWIKSNGLADSVAAGLLTSSKLPVTSGQVLIIGTPEAQIGDYIYIKIPSLELNGASIEGYFYVYRVQHMLDSGKFHTLLDVGKVKKVAEDYLAQVSATAKLCKKALVKG